MAKRSKTSPASDAAAELDLSQARIKITAAGGPRRRAGHSFGPQPTILTMSDLGETDDEIRAAIEALSGDPQLSIVPVIDEGEPGRPEED